MDTLSYCISHTSGVMQLMVFGSVVKRNGCRLILVKLHKAIRTKTFNLLKFVFLATYNSINSIIVGLQ